MSEQSKEWIAPLVRSMLSAPTIEDTVGPVTCPICECDHQVFQGMGCFAPTQEGTSLTCCFPSARTMAEIEMPKDIKVGGLVTYTRYACACGGHNWALMAAYHKDQSISWCVDLAPPKKKKCGSDGKSKEPFDSPVFSSIQNLLQGIAAGGVKPVVMLGSGIVNGIPPEALAALQAQGAQILPPGGPPGAPPQIPKPNLEPDHEDPLVRLPANVRYAWQNWPEKHPLPEAEILNFQLPKLPVTHAAKNKPPHLAVGTNGTSAEFTSMQEWLFTVAVDVKPESKLAIHAMVYWDRLLIVVSSAVKESRRDLTKDIANTIIGMNKLKPDIYMMTRRDYLVLVSNKAEESAKKKKP